MATNKNAMARYRALDKCFSSRTRKYYMNDLIEACRMALERQNGDSGSKGAEGVQRRQIFDDMNDMELMYGSLSTESKTAIKNITAMQSVQRLWPNPVLPKKKWIVYSKPPPS
mgnify:FL=1